MKTLLRLVYCLNTRAADLDNAIISDICVALDKYCVKSFPRAVVDRLMALADQEPELAYIHACRFGLHEVARAAATASLRVPRLFAKVPLSDLNISTRQYHALVSYRADCLEKAMGAVTDYVWMGQLQPSPPGLRHERSCGTCYEVSPRAWSDQASVLALGCF